MTRIASSESSTRWIHERPPTRTAPGQQPGVRCTVSLALALCLAGCYSSSTKFHGDAGSDPGADTHVDPGIDPWTDTWTDPGYDTGYDPGSDSTTVCPPPDPPPDGPEISWVVDGSYSEEGAFLLRCQVDSFASGDDGTTAIGLTCPSSSGTIERHTVEITSWPSLYVYLLEGEWVELEYVAEPIWWVNRWFAIRSEGGDIVVAGVDAERLYPDPGSWFYGNIDLFMMYGICENVSADCGVYERLGILVELGDAGQIVHDRTHAVVGEMVGVQVMVGEASSYVEMWCEDYPYEWVSALFARSPEG